jgi:farnesyl-diphosphate farnesyltransferase
VAWIAGARFDIAWREFKQQMGELLFNTKPTNATIEVVKETVKTTVDHSEL